MRGNPEPNSDGLFARMIKQLDSIQHQKLFDSVQTNVNLTVTEFISNMKLIIWRQHTNKSARHGVV